MITLKTFRNFCTRACVLPVGTGCDYLTYRMFSKKLSYEEAVHQLNSLQSNKSTLQQIRRDLKSGKKCTNLEDMEKYLLRTGITLSMLDQLSVIHVAGTKGKGSTSAMCESILRAHGFRTGFYSSPHLVAVRERVRLDGSPMSEQAFADHLQQVYSALYDTQEYSGDMPKYFAFLTVLAFNVFLKERVDVAVVEVGIGGIVDYTNILRQVPVVGITSLGLDHTSILGNTLAEIAAAKAGIMKRNCVAYTVQQPLEAMEVLKRTAISIKCPLRVVPDYSTYSSESANFDIPLDAYRVNASLAIQLAHAWMRLIGTNLKKYQKQKNGTVHANGCKELYSSIKECDTDMIVNTLTKETALGLKECNWPGRYQIIDTCSAQFYLDGAHTKESIEICAAWYDSKNRCQDKILIFSATGDRDAEVLLKPLMKINFKSVYFVIPTAYKTMAKQHDNYSILERDELFLKCKNHACVWNQNINKSTTKLYVMESVSDALLHINKGNQDVSVLITGSLHLIGAALSIIDPKQCINKG